jgi:hypothetical protein
MHDQDLHVPDTSGDNETTIATDVSPEAGTTTAAAETELEIPPVATEEPAPVIETDDPVRTPMEVSQSVEEMAQQMFSNGTKPLAINLQLLPTAKQGHLTPTATVEIAPSLRSSGLLAALPAEEVKTLVALLTFLTPNGEINPTASEVAQGLHISEGKAKERLSRLLRFRWHGRSLVATLWRETGMDGFTLTPDVVSYRQVAPPRNTSSQPTYRAVGRDAVIAQSRERYSRPRAEVERQIAMAQGWPLPEEQAAAEAEGTTHGTAISPMDYLRQRLLRLGVTSEQAAILLETFPVAEIEQQIAWLPYRGAKNLASYLVAAITGHYAEPGLLKLRREQGPEATFTADVLGPSEEAV